MIKIENIEQFVKYATSLNYRYAKTFTNFAPHEYAMAKDNTKELEIIRSLNKYIQEHGEKEMYYRSKPTSEEILETYQILRDFGIHIKKSEIPKKNTVGELHRWRYQIIKNYILS